MELLDEIGSDHIPIKVTLKQEPVSAQICTIRKWKFNKDNLQQFTNRITTSQLQMPNNINIIVEDFTDRLNKAASSSMKKTSGKIKTRKNAVWWDEECSRVVGARRKAFRKLSRHPTSQNLADYKEKHLIANNLCKAKKKESMEEFIKEISFEMPIGTVWRRIKSLKGYTFSESTPIIDQGNMVVNPKDKANLFSEYFQSVSTSGTHTQMSDFQDLFREACESRDELYNIDISIPELESALSQTRNSAPGEDMIPYAFLSALDNEILVELCSILNQSFKLGIIPATWKSAIIIPIRKPHKPKEDVKSYRPIALLSCMGKILELIIKNRLEYVLETNNFLSEAQCGFRKEKSTIDVLLRLERSIRSALVNKQFCMVVYIDLKSAFDTVWGEGLIYKLIKSGIRGSMIKWLKNYFDNRTIKTFVDGCFSDPYLIQAGTPQGAVLSPLLFNAMLSDVPSAPDVEVLMYADDITITCRGDNIEEVRQKVQNYIDDFQSWCEKWGMVISPQKTVFQYFTRKKIGAPITLNINGQSIQYMKSQKLLGLFLDSPYLTWKDHITYLKKDCIRRMDLLKSISSIKWGASTVILRNFYNAYIRAKIDYGAEVYGASSASRLKVLDSIQNSCLRLVLGARKTSPIYSVEVEAAVPSLEIHRNYLNLKLLIKLKSRPCNDGTAVKLNLDGNSMEPNRFPFSSFCWRAVKSLNYLQIERVKRMPSDIFNLPPWEDINKYIVLSYQQPVHSDADFKSYVSDQFPDYVHMYTDGSKRDGDHISSACGIYFPSFSYSECWKLNAEHSVLSAQLYAMYKSLLFIKNNNLDNCIIFSDSLSGLQLLYSAKPKTYVVITGKIRKLLYELNKTRSILFHWIRAHCGIQGNEIVDKVAQKGHENNMSELYDLSKEEIISVLKRKVLETWNEEWKFNTDYTGKGLFLRSIREDIEISNPIVQLRNRRHEVAIYCLRIGHAGLNDHCYRFNMCISRNCAFCHTPETIDHYIFDCVLYTMQREHMLRMLSQIGIVDPSLGTILGGEHGGKERQSIYKIVVHYLINTGRISDI